MRFSNGVAQECLLGLVLFSTFICGIGKGMDSKISRFVDDAKLFWEIKCFANDKGLQKNLAKVSGWAKRAAGMDMPGEAAGWCQGPLETIWG